MIDYAIHIEARAELVYDMLTDAVLLTEWMAETAEVDHRPGGSFRWVYENGDVVLGRFVEVEPPHRLVLAYGWERPAERGIPPESTVVEITLKQEGEATLLRLVHRGLPAAEVDSHRYGWEYFVGRLVLRLTWARRHMRERAMDDDANRVVDAYYAAWATGDYDRVGAVLSDDFRFSGPMGAAESPAAFVEQIRRNSAMFGSVRFAEERRVADGPLVVNLYTFVAGSAQVPMAEAFEVRGDRIARIDLYFDPSPFMRGSGGR